MTTFRSWHSWNLSSKITSLITLGVVTSILIIVFGSISYLKKEYLAIVGRQLSSTVQAYAMSLDADLSGKLQAVTNAADITPATVFDNPAAGERYLTHFAGINTLFDDGLMLITAHGEIVAATAVSPASKLNKDISALPFFQQARDEGRPFISEPFSSIMPGGKPVVQFVAPIRNESGIIAGYFAGGLTLNGDNILGSMAHRKVGQSGYFYIYSKKRTMLIHPDNSRIMKNDVPPGANRLFDLALSGFEGSGETVNSRGLHAMASFHPLTSTPWILAANYPMEELLASFYTTRRMIILTITLCGTIIILLTWWTIFRFMTPLNRYIAHLQSGSGYFDAKEAGPELNQIATAFNAMLIRTEESKSKLAANEELQRALLDASPDPIFFKDAKGRWLLANQAALHLFNLSGIDYQGKINSELAQFTPFYYDALTYSEQSEELAWQHQSSITSEETIISPDQKNHILEITKTPIFYKNGQRKAMVIIGRDMTERLENEERIRMLTLAIEQSPVCTVITDLNGNIEFVNPQFTRLTGYTLEEVLGQNPRVLKTDLTPPGVHVKLWKTITSGKTWEGEFINKTKDNRIFIEHAIVSPIFNHKGEITHFMAVKDDITAKRQSEEIIWRQANYDSLTQIPNRNYFLDRLQYAVASSAREHSALTLFFLDLDHFKEVNDSLGHDFGDLLLIQVVERIQACIRETDTVARYGGDEFLVLATGIENKEDIIRMAEKLINTIHQPFQLDRSEATVSVSIGISTCPGDTNDAGILLKNADQAMYIAKKSGRNCWRMFSDTTNAA